MLLMFCHVNRIRHPYLHRGQQHSLHRLRCNLLIPWKSLRSLRMALQGVMQNPSPRPLLQTRGSPLEE